MTQQGQIFSATDNCRPFDHRADGMVPADAAVAVVLTRMTNTPISQQDLYGIIAGAAVGSDGATEKAGYQVPSPRGQADVIKRAWDVAGLGLGIATYVKYVYPLHEW